MNLFEGFEAQANQNLLDTILNASPFGQNLSNDERLNYEYQSTEKNCVTYQWILSDEEPQSPNSIQTQDSSVEEMKSARLAQQEKLQEFLSTLPPIDCPTRKSSVMTQASCSSPKKKRIRKPKRK